MSIAAFYRNWVPFVTTYSYYDDDTGENVIVTTEPYFVKGNIQPFKQGTMFSLAEYGTSYKNYRTLYLKKTPVYIDLPPDVSQLKTYAWVSGDSQVGQQQGWYVIIASKDFTKAGRAPKHYVFDCIYTATDQPGPEGSPLGEPVPFPELVDSFEAVIRELHELTPLVIEEIS